MTVSEKHIKPPFGDQRFDTFDQWVNRAASWLTCHAEYNNTEHGDKKGWRGDHFTALCFDSFGRRCKCGADMQRARDEKAFPVWWIWPDQIIDALAAAEREGMRHAAMFSAIHSQYPIENDYDKGYAQGAKDAHDRIIQEVNSHIHKKEDAQR